MAKGHQTPSIQPANWYPLSSTWLSWSTWSDFPAIFTLLIGNLQQSRAATRDGRAHHPTPWTRKRTVMNGWITVNYHETCNWCGGFLVDGDEMMQSFTSKLQNISCHSEVRVREPSMACRGAECWETPVTCNFRILRISQMFKYLELADKCVTWTVSNSTSKSSNPKLKLCLHLLATLLKATARDDSGHAEKLSASFFWRPNLRNCQKNSEETSWKIQCAAGK